MSARSKLFFTQRQHGANFCRMRGLRALMRIVAHRANYSFARDARPARARKHRPDAAILALRASRAIARAQNKFS